MRGATFDPREVEAERHVIGEERARDLDSPLGRLDQTHLAARLPPPSLPQPDPRLARRPGADHASTTCAPSTDQHYRPDGAVLVIVGDVEPERALDRVAAHFGPLAARRRDRRPPPLDRAAADGPARLHAGRRRVGGAGLARLAHRAQGASRRPGDLRHGLPRGRRAERALRDARVAAGTGFQDESVCRAARVDRGGREGLRRVGAAPGRPRLRDRRDRRQGRLVRPAAASRRPPRPAALGARLQVGADDGGDEAPQDRDPCRPHGRAQPLGDHGAGKRRRRHGLARDPAQRGGHQPQADPRRRPGDRPARRRRHPSDRRAGRAAREGHEGVQDARALPALRRRGRQARGRGRCTAARTAPALLAASRP